MDYTPGIVPDDPLEVQRFLREELQKLAYVLREAPARNLEFRTVAPTKPREGMIYGADGTSWNPGGGKGIYAYYGGAWTKL